MDTKSNEHMYMTNKPNEHMYITVGTCLLILVLIFVFIIQSFIFIIHIPNSTWSSGLVSISYLEVVRSNPTKDTLMVGIKLQGALLANSCRVDLSDILIVKALFPYLKKMKIFIIRMILIIRMCVCTDSQISTCTQVHEEHGAPFSKLRHFIIFGLYNFKKLLLFASLNFAIKDSFFKFKFKRYTSSVFLDVTLS